MFIIIFGESKILGLYKTVDAEYILPETHVPRIIKQYL